MLDRLLGRQELKEEIRDLKSQLRERKSSLKAAEKRLEKAEKRRKDAVSEKQEAQRERNRLQEKVENLEARVEEVKEEDEERTGAGFSHVVSIDPDDLDHRLSNYRSPDEDLVTLVSPDLSGEDVLDDLEGDLSPVKGFEGGGVLLHDQAGLLTATAVPPVLKAEPSMRYGDSFDTSALDLKDLREEHVFCLVRSDESSLARIRSGEATGFRRVTTGVKGKHGKGGFSQKRFQRLREEQVEKHVEDTAEALREMIDEGDFLAIGGDAEVAEEVLNQIDIEDGRSAVKALDVSDVEDEEDLLRAVEMFWQVRVYVA